MKSEDVKALVSYRMEKSEDAIKAAEIMLKNEMLWRHKAILLNRQKVAHNEFVFTKQLHFSAGQGLPNLSSLTRSLFNRDEIFFAFISSGWQNIKIQNYHSQPLN